MLKIAETKDFSNDAFKYEKKNKIAIERTTILQTVK